MTEQKKKAILAQLELLLRLNAAQRIRVKRGDKYKVVAKADVIEDELRALFEYVRDSGELSAVHGYGFDGVKVGK